MTNTVTNFMPAQYYTISNAPDVLLENALSNALSWQHGTMVFSNTPMGTPTLLLDSQTARYISDSYIRFKYVETFSALLLLIGLLVGLGWLLNKMIKNGSI